MKSGDGWSVYYKQYLFDEDGNERASKLVSVLDGPYTQSGTDELEALFGSGKIFPFLKPSTLIEKFVSTLWMDENAIILDFFSGSSSSAQAVFQFNRKENKHFSFIMVQLPQPCDPDSEAFKAGFSTIAEIGKERIRRVGTRIKSELLTAADRKQPGLLPEDDLTIAPDPSLFDVGFRVLKIDSSNMKDSYYTPDEVLQSDLLGQVENIRPDRTPEDLLFQVLIDWGIDLALPIATEHFDGRTIFFVDGDSLAACFDAGITDELVKEIAKRKPLLAVFRDASYGSDSVKINVEQIFRLLSPETEVRSI